MKRPFTIIIADRNRHVREFLMREMRAEGYQVLLAKNGREVLERVCHDETSDLLILDLDLPDASELNFLEKLQDRVPILPVVVHSFLSEHMNHPLVLSATAVVEKAGNSIDLLKKVVSEILLKSYPRRSKYKKQIGPKPAKRS